MINPTKTHVVAGIGAASVIAAFGFGITVSTPAPVEAAGFVGVSIGAPFSFPFH